MYFRNDDSIENTNRRVRSPVPRDNHIIYDQTIYSAPIMELPQGWSRHISTNGRPFYFNASLNISQWNFPFPEIPSVQERVVLAQRINELEQLRNRITREIEQLRSREH